MSKQQYQP